ncbi:MAG: ATP-dependent RecD-like DNA helicase [Syntrophorhabdaceae bacterium PtaU1.Bin034]|nr:MAG: ATP-dependent RecD-like DNA helicase [Syntrophorhabdaceae bacterium PtaU1.Bin034]
MTEIRGQIERLTFYNEENGYTVARMKVQGRAGLVTVVGNILGLNPGEVLKLKGEWSSHPKYGEQFRITSYESVIPATVSGIERYLSSGMIKGIGPVMAKRLVAKFGAKTLEVIEDDIERLKEVDGIGEKRVDMIRNAWQAQKEIRQVMVFLQGHGVSPAYAVKIYRQYGNEAVSVVRDNPYRLAEDVFGIGFITADKIAEKLGIAKDSPIRARAGIQYILNRLSDEGHVYYPFDPLVDQCEKALEIDRGIILDAMNSAASDRRIVIDETNGSEGQGRAVYLIRFYVSEQGIAKRMHELLSFPRQMPLVNREELLESAQRKLGLVLSPYQAQAVSDSIERKVMVITGGPGTGKTTIIKGIIAIQEKMGRRVMLAAPTGRAAKRMSETTGHEARTIHRLLELSPKDGKFKKDEDNPLEADTLIIDETSMVDTTLMYYLLKAVPLQASLILVGDVDQLPSVGAGNVLRDIIDSNVVPMVRLNEIFRQSRESMIIVNAHRINSGRMPMATEAGGQSKADFHFLEVEEPEKAVERIISLCRERIPKRFGYHAVNDIQVLTPMHRGTVGAANLNAELQKQLNPSGDEFVRGGKTFKPGDKVMQIRNNYDKDVYNGDIGRIVKIDREEQEVYVNIDGKVVSYDFSELDELVLAYATSVHKAQGSEYPCIVMPVLIQHYMLLQRNLLYTGITRGKRLVVLVGTKKALAIAVRNNKTQLRHTLLKERLQKGMS